MADTHVSARTVLWGFLAAFLALAALAAVVGIDAVVGGLADAEPRATAAALGVAAAWLVAWGLSLYVALRTLRVDVTPWRSVLVYASATFFNGLTPFAQVGGEALSAAVIARSTDTEYETGLAAVASVDLVNLAPSPAFALAGLVSLVAAGERSAELRLAAMTVFGVAMAAVVAGALAWRFRTDVGRSLTRTTVGAVAAANRVTGRVLPVDTARLAGRVEAFLGGVGRVFGYRRRLVVCLGLSTAGWGCLVLAFWLSLRAVGHPVGGGLAAFVLPVGMLAIAIPLPGGVGGIEAALVGLLVAVGGVPVAGATAGVVLYRGATYWAPLLFGGAVTAALTVEARAHRR
ncbi:lysylphosphatidylglycerol synthase transmembrane domain-containing protein [Halorussus sp. AFM4]|uniref:lysylphosphatidylglycerol synthase transmembrane domain-containing protein n=1 Tax=Halorussus sp. AFM4 TaxID=3421651 RepID=UPI003EBEF69F